MRHMGQCKVIQRFYDDLCKFLKFKNYLIIYILEYISISGLVVFAQ